MPDGRPSSSWVTVPKNQNPVSATPTKSRPGFVKRKADNAPKCRELAVSSSPPTNSNGPNWRSARPMRNSLIGLAVTVMSSSGADPARDKSAGEAIASAATAAKAVAHRRKESARGAHPTRRWRRLSRGVSSPNSEASCSVIAPASSSASTMVTARR